MDYAIKIVEQSGRELTDYQVKVEITDPDFFSKCTDQKYVEFYDEDKQTLLSHYTELFDTVNKIAVFWVKVPSIPANGIKYIYLNINTERTEDLSDPSKVFDFFDDFEDADISDWVFTAGNWQVTEEAAYHGSYGLEEITTNPGVGWGYCSKSFSLNELILEYYARQTETEGGSGLCVFSEWNSGNPSGYMIWIHPGNDVVQIYRVDSGSPTQLKSASKTLEYNQWYKLKLVIKADGTIEGYVNDALVVTATDTTYQQFSYVGVRVSRAVQYDYIIVRKYTEPEPSVTVIRLGTTPTYELKLKIAQALAGEATTILDTDPKLRLLSGSNIIKELSLTAKTVYKDSVNNRVVVAFLFVDDSSDSYTTDNQELLFTKDSTEYVAFKSSKTFTKVADKRLPLRWEIYLPYDVDVCTYEETMIGCL